MISKIIDRRKFLNKIALSTGSIMPVIYGQSFVNIPAVTLKEYGAVPQSFDLMKEIKSYRKIDAYAHAVINDESAIAQLEQADRLGIEKLIVSVPVAKKMDESPDEIRAYNDLVLKAVKRNPTRLAGQFTLNPANYKNSLEEIKRCLDAGMVGVKLYNQYKINNPRIFPVLEKLIGYNIIIHVHGESQLGVGGYRMKYDVQNTPTISVPEDLADVAKRYPEAIFQYAHIGGGSDWEYACKTFTEFPNIYVDTGGSNNSENMVDFAVEHLGEGRVFFGCDGSFYQGVGNIIASRLTKDQKRKLFFDNYNYVLKKSGLNFI